MKGSTRSVSRGEVVAPAGSSHAAMQQKVIFLVCEELGVTPLQLLCPDRTRPLPMARQLSAWLMWNWGFTMQQAADSLGVSVSTVGYYCRNVERRRANGEWRTICRRLWLMLTPLDR